MTQNYNKEIDNYFNFKLLEIKREGKYHFNKYLIPNSEKQSVKDKINLFDILFIKTENYEID